jgi:hypothetical protein
MTRNATTETSMLLDLAFCGAAYVMGAVVTYGTTFMTLKPVATGSTQITPVAASEPARADAA